MSMAAKMSNRGDNMTEANLQADGLMEEPAQRAADWWKQLSLGQVEQYSFMGDILWERV